MFEPAQKCKEQCKFMQKYTLKNVFLLKWPILVVSPKVEIKLPSQKIVL